MCDDDAINEADKALNRDGKPWRKRAAHAMRGVGWTFRTIGALAYECLVVAAEAVEGGRRE